MWNLLCTARFWRSTGLWRWAPFTAVCCAGGGQQQCQGLQQEQYLSSQGWIGHQPKPGDISWGWGAWGHWTNCSASWMIHLQKQRSSFFSWCIQLHFQKERFTLCLRWIRHCLIICLHFLYMLFINHTVAHLPYFWHSSTLTPADRPYAHILTPLSECVLPITILVYTVHLDKCPYWETPFLKQMACVQTSVGTIWLIHLMLWLKRK